MRIGGRDRHVRDLAGGTGRATIELPVKHEPQSDTGPYVQVREVVHVLAEPMPPLTDRGQIHVVLEPHGYTERGSEIVEHPLATPTGKIVGQCQVPGGWLEDAGAADDDVGDLAGGDPGLGGKRVGHLRHLADERCRAGSVRRFIGPRRDLTGEVRHRATHAVGADVQPDHPARARVQFVQNGRWPFATRAAAGRADKLRGLEGRERLRDGRLGQS